MFKNTLPSKLYWILFRINNLRDFVDAMKRVLTKEKLDKQLSGQEQLENLTSMVYNMYMQKEEGKKPFKPQVYPKRARGQRRQNFEGRDRSFYDGRQRQSFRQSQNR